MGRTKTRNILLSIVAVCFACSSAFAANLLPPGSIPAPPASGKIRVFMHTYSYAWTATSSQIKGDWPQGHKEFEDEQMQLVREFLDESGGYELVSARDVQAVFPAGVPEFSVMKKKEWALLKESGKVLFADYAIVAMRTTEDGLQAYIEAAIVDIATGKSYAVRAGEQISVMTNPSSRTRMSRRVSQDLISKAKNDILATARAKRSLTQTAGVGVTQAVAPSAPQVKKQEQAAERREPANIVIHVQAPDASAGAAHVSGSKAEMTGKVSADHGVAEVYVNGKSANLSADGGFNATVLLRIGVNDVSIVAVDTRGNKETKTIKIERQAQAASKAEVARPLIQITSPDPVRGVKIVSTMKTVIMGKATSEKGVAEVIVNGESAAIDAEGNFSAEILLKVGMNEVTVIAMDTLGAQSTKTVRIDRQSQKVNVAKEEEVSPAIVKKGKYHALIIGNNNYKSLPKLITARKDAAEVEKILREQYGFDTKTLLDATRSDILNAINYFRKTLNESDSFLLYYAGHGEFDKKADKSYWLPVDAQSDDDTNWIIADDLTANLKRISSRHVLVVADSCYAGTLTRSFNIDLSRGSREEYLKKMQERISRSLIASGGNEPVSDSGGGGNSVFAEAFLKALRDIDKPAFSAEELFYAHIKERVAGKSDQVPEYNTIKNSGHEGGDFVFMKSRER